MVNRTVTVRGSFGLRTGRVLLPSRVGRVAPVVMPPRRARPTLRCVTDDLNLALPPLDVYLGALDHPALREVRRLAAESPIGQKRILAIDHPLVYRMRVGGDRGATWVDDERNVLWLCALRRRQAGSADDAPVASEVRADWSASVSGAHQSP